VGLHLPRSSSLLMIMWQVAWCCADLLDVEWWHWSVGMVGSGVVVISLAICNYHVATWKFYA